MKPFRKSVHGKEFEVQECNSWFSIFRGLMFSRRKNLLFIFDKERKVGIHMLFVFFSIDVYWLDKDFRVIDLRKKVKPFTFAGSDKKAKYVLEISKNKVGLRVGNKGKIYKTFK